MPWADRVHFHFSDERRLDADVLRDYREGHHAYTCGPAASWTRCSTPPRASAGRRRPCTASTRCPRLRRASACPSSSAARLAAYAVAPTSAVRTGRRPQVDVMQRRLCGVKRFPPEGDVDHHFVLSKEQRKSRWAVFPRRAGGRGGGAGPKEAHPPPPQPLAPERTTEGDKMKKISLIGAGLLAPALALAQGGAPAASSVAVRRLSVHQLGALLATGAAPRSEQLPVKRHPRGHRGSEDLGGGLQAFFAGERLQRRHRRAIEPGRVLQPRNPAGLRDQRYGTLILAASSRPTSPCRCAWTRSISAGMAPASRCSSAARPACWATRRCTTTRCSNISPSWRCRRQGDGGQQRRRSPSATRPAWRWSTAARPLPRPVHDRLNPTGAAAGQPALASVKNQVTSLGASYT